MMLSSCKLALLFSFVFHHQHISYKWALLFSSPPAHWLQCQILSQHPLNIYTLNISIYISTYHSSVQWHIGNSPLAHWLQVSSAVQFTTGTLVASELFCSIHHQHIGCKWAVLFNSPPLVHCLQVSCSIQFTTNTLVASELFCSIHYRH